MIFLIKASDTRPQCSACMSMTILLTVIMITRTLCSSSLTLSRGKFHNLNYMALIRNMAHDVLERCFNI